MKVSDFKKLVAEIPAAFDDYEVLQARDPAGNGFVPFSVIGGPFRFHRNELYDEHDWTDFVDDETAQPWDPNVVVLWPDYWEED